MAPLPFFIEDIAGSAMARRAGAHDERGACLKYGSPRDGVLTNLPGSREETVVKALSRRCKVQRRSGTDTRMGELVPGQPRKYGGEEGGVT